MFTVNNSFKSTLYRIKVPPVASALSETDQERQQRSPKESEQDLRDIERKVTADRQYIIDAAIMRIMKSKRRLGHQELTTEVFKACQGWTVLAADIKKRVESLMERTYLERDGADSGVYNYVA